MNEYVYCTNCVHFKIKEETWEPECVNEHRCCLLDPEDSMPFEDRPFYEALPPEPELGNMLFGNSPFSGEFPVVPRDVLQDMFVETLSKIGCDGYGHYDAGTFDVSSALKASEKNGGVCNDVFEINPYYWGEDEEIAALPNFIYKPIGFKIWWYKYPLRDAWCNCNLKGQKLVDFMRSVLNDCEQSAKNSWVCWYTTEEKMPENETVVMVWIQNAEKKYVLCNSVWNSDGWKILSGEEEFEVIKWRYC